jgi:P4 family phage/plasmid primase-like protien
MSRKKPETSEPERDEAINLNSTVDDRELLEGLEAIQHRKEEFSNADVGDIDIMLEVNASVENPDQKKKVRKKLIENEYILVDGEPEDKNATVEKVDVERFKDDIGFEESYNPLDYFTESVHGNEKFDAEKMAEELLDQHEFLKIQGRENGLKIYVDGVWKEQQFAVETIEREVNERLGQETSSRYRSNVKNIIKNHREVQIEEDKFEHPKMRIPYSNGVYDLEEGDLKEYQPEFYFTFKYDAEYRPELDNRDVEEFVEDIAPESEEKRKKLHEIAALTLAPWRVKEIMPILFGKGSNGKNQFVNVLKKILGKENYHISSSQRISEDKFESATMHEAELLFLDEFEDASSPSNLKRLTDSEQNIRRMNKEPGTVETSVQPIFAANELPNPKEDSDGFYRRWQIINFTQKFTEEDDGNPDKLSPTELEEKYMSKEAIDSYATSLVTHLEDVVERNKLTDQQSQSKVRAIWQEKASAVYHFIDNFLTQGDIKYSDDEKYGDYIIKKELTKLVNSYLDDNNLSKTNTQHLTRALEKHPDIDVNSSARPRPGDDIDPDRPTAYEGVRIRDDRVHDVRAVLPLYAWRSPQLLRLTNHRKYVDITDNDKTAIAIEFLKQHSKKGVDMVKLIKELNLSHTELDSINSSDYIRKDQKEKNNVLVPFYSVNKSKLEEDVEDVDLVYDKEGRSVRPLNWLRDEMDSWSKHTVKDIEEVVARGTAAGFSEDSIEEVISKLKDEGELFEPQPGRVKILG